MNLLPVDIFRLILIQIPNPSYYKSVCKKWKSKIKHPIFQMLWKSSELKRLTSEFNKTKIITQKLMDIKDGIIPIRDAGFYTFTENIKGRIDISGIKISLNMCGYTLCGGAGLISINIHDCINPDDKDGEWDRDQDEDKYNIVVENGKIIWGGAAGIGLAINMDNSWNILVSNIHVFSYKFLRKQRRNKRQRLKWRRKGRGRKVKVKQNKNYILTMNGIYMIVTEGVMLDQ